MINWKPKLGNLSLWLALSVVAVFAGQVPAHSQDAAAPAELFLEDTSPQGFVATVDAFTAGVSDAGWSILGKTNMAGVLSERGFTVDPVLVFEPCSGAYSSELLGRDETRFVSSMIPCRVAIYKTSAGDVVISRINTGAMAEMIGGDAAPIIRQSGEELEAIIDSVLQELEQ